MDCGQMKACFMLLAYIFSPSSSLLRYLYPHLPTPCPLPTTISLSLSFHPKPVLLQPCQQ